MRLRIKLLGYILDLRPTQKDVSISECMILKDAYIKHINNMSKILAATQEKLLLEVGFKIDS